jgi:energy-converting hydrogenase Eha subunit C
VADRGDARIAALALLASGFVMAAPVLGRTGYAGAAEVTVVLAASCGLGSFLLAGLATVRAARARSRSAREAEDAS